MVATVSDQDRTNEGVIKLKLVTLEKNEEYRNDEMYKVYVDRALVHIIHLFDVPYLIKCIKNNLIFKDLYFEIDGRICKMVPYRAVV